MTLFFFVSFYFFVFCLFFQNQEWTSRAMRINGSIFNLMKVFCGCFFLKKNRTLNKGYSYRLNVVWKERKSHNKTKHDFKIYLNSLKSSIRRFRRDMSEEVLHGGDNGNKVYTGHSWFQCTLVGAPAYWLLLLKTRVIRVFFNYKSCNSHVQTFASLETDLREGIEKWICVTCSVVWIVNNSADWRDSDPEKLFNTSGSGRST